LRVKVSIPFTINFSCKLGYPNQ